MPPNLRYCPVCGQPLGQRQDGGRLRQACAACGYVRYENPVPAVGILIEQDDGVVLIQRKQPPHKDRWTLPSGYIEADESAEDAAVREAEEETGLKVEILDLLGINSFPEGPPLSGIMIFYRARAIGGALQAGDDAADARVFPASSMPLLPFRTHREAMAQWLAQRAMDDGAVPAVVKPSLVIRPAEAADEEEILALLHLIPVNHVIGREEWRTIRQRLREADTIEVFVAEDRQTTPMIVGFAALSVVRALTGGIGLINDMAVLPTYQRRGVGAALLDAVVKRAERLSLTTIWVNAGRANARARAFYASIGFDEGDLLTLRLR